MAYNLTSWMSFANHGPKVGLTLPPLSFLKFPPSDIPQTLPPPSDHPTLAHPFAIPIDLYNAALSPNVPVLAALGYATTIHFLNGVNERRNYKPWAFSKTYLFKCMVITHNIILALYSAWTFVGMINALSTSLYPPWAEYGLAGTVDSLCKIHGPRGPGSAAIYEESTSAWSIANRFFHLGADGLAPESTDVGRIWNQGLAFYGWLFYLSKFYEVIDTLIIIAKGKKSSFLQTYHHAGAMLCMWAGIRYMSAPIWMFVLVNSFIHSIMYTFYLCSAIRVRVPVWFKKTLTTLQITQFVVGASYAFVHLFIKYETPVSIPYTYHLGNVVSSAALDASSVASSVISTVTAIATDDWQALLRKAALRAAGREGLAENVYNRHGQRFGVDAAKAAQNWANRQETRYRDELQWTHCLSTSGQTFAVLLNVVYLLPLTWLFANFFIQSYLQRVERRRSSTASQKAQLAKESAKDAAKRSGRRLSQAFEDSQAGVEDTGDEIAVIDGQKLKANAKKAATKIKKQAGNAASSAEESLSNGISVVKEESSKLASQGAKKAEGTASSIKRKSGDVASKIDKETKPAVTEAKQGMATTLDNLQEQADSVKAKAEDLYQANVEYIKGGFEKTRTAISSLVKDKGEDETGGSSGGTDERESAGDVSGGQEDEDGTSERNGSGSNVASGVDQESPERDEESKHDRNDANSNFESESAQPDNTKSSAGLDRTDQGAQTKDDSITGSAQGNGTSGEPQDSSPDGQVNQQNPSSEVKAEANADGTEDVAPAEQASKDIGRENTSYPKESSQEERPKQDANVESAEGEQVTGEGGDSEERSGEVTVENAVASARQTASNVKDTVQDTVKDLPSLGTDEGVVAKAQDGLENIQSGISQRLKGSGKDGADADDGRDTQDYEDQKESWIHIDRDEHGVKQKSQEGSNPQSNATAASANADSDGAKPTTATQKSTKASEDGPSDPEATEGNPDVDKTDETEPTYADVVSGSGTNVDMTEREEPKSAEENATDSLNESDKKVDDGKADDEAEENKKEVNKIIDESELLRDEVVDKDSASSTNIDEAGEDSTSGSKQEQDKIIDESEAVRDEPIDQGSFDEEPSSTISDAQDPADTKSGVDSTTVQEEILAESEPVRDQIQDTNDPSTGAKDDDNEEVEAGA